MIDKFEVGLLKTNCYIIHDKKEAIIIDPGYSDERIYDFLVKNNLTAKLIFLTHCHFDHILGVTWLKEKTGANIGICDKEYENAKNPEINLSRMMLGKDMVLTCDKIYYENDVIEIGEYSFKLIYTPGHTFGSCCLYSDGVLISGDTIFKESHGRCDLPTGNYSLLISSIKEKIKKLPTDTEIYPGHGEITTLSDFLMFMRI